jgi:secreted trypsin-like serine protease
MFGLNLAKKAAAVTAAVAAAATTCLLGAPTASAAPQPIVGGSTTTAAAYPYVMQITDASQNQFCGGTLVSATKVVTAAHCMVGETTSSVEWSAAAPTSTAPTAPSARSARSGSTRATWTPPTVTTWPS